MISNWGPVPTCICYLIIIVYLIGINLWHNLKIKKKEINKMVPTIHKSSLRDEQQFSKVITNSCIFKDLKLIAMDELLTRHLRTWTLLLKFYKN